MSKQTKKPTSLEGLASAFISVTEASKLSGLSVSRIRKLIVEKRIEGVKVGRNWVTTEEAVREYLKQERRPGPKPRKK